MTRLIPVPEGLAGMRADAGIAKLLGLSRAKTADLLLAQAITMDGETLEKSQPLRAGALLEIDLVEESAYVPEVTPVAGMKVLFEDADVIVVDKPAGVAAHTGPGWDGPTVVGALRAAGVRISTSGPVEREGIVHRLDAGTSGVMVVAKSELAYGRLKNEFRYHRVTKIYCGLAQGIVKPGKGTIDAPIGRQVGREFKMAVMAGGKESITHYDTVSAYPAQPRATAKESLPAVTLLRVQLETGRTHQIRVHFAAIGHPLVGDTLYGADAKLAAKLGIQRQFLHAEMLQFKHPREGSPVRVQAGLPEDLSRVLQLWSVQD